MRLSVDHKPKEYYTKKWYIRMTIKLPSETDDKARVSVHDNVNKAFLWYASRYPDLMEQFGGTQNVFRLLLAGTYKGSERKTNIGDVVKLENMDQGGVIHAQRPRRLEPTITLTKKPEFSSTDDSDLPTADDIKNLGETKYNELFDMIVESITPCIARTDQNGIEHLTIRQLIYETARTLGLLQSQKPKIPLSQTLDARLQLLAHEAKTKPYKAPVLDNLQKMKIDFKLKGI